MPILVILPDRVIAQLGADPLPIGANLHHAGLELIAGLYDVIPPGKPKADFRSKDDVNHFIWEILDGAGVPDSDWVSFAPDGHNGPPCAIVAYRNGVDIDFVMKHWRTHFSNNAKSVADVDLANVRVVTCLNFKWV